MTELILDPVTQLVTVDAPNLTPSVQWDQAAQQAVINTSIGPTIAARVYGMVHTAMFDAWASYDPTAVGTRIGDELQRPAEENTDDNKTEAMSFAAHHVLTELFPSEVELFDNLMEELGFDPNNGSTDPTTPAGIGNIAGETLLEFRREDGSNQLGNDPNGTPGVPYSDTTDYEPVNSADNIVDLENWTPERVPTDAEPGEELRVQEFLTPQWGEVTPFAIGSGEALRPVAPEPFLLVEGETDLEAQTITLEDGSVVDISRDIIGTIINPDFIAQTEEVVEFSANLTDEEKLIAEFWEDGGGTSFPPGTWMTFGQFESVENNNSLDEDAVLFNALGNAVFDAGIAAWESKVFYDYARPVRTVRELGRLGLIGEPGVDEVTGEEGFVIEANVLGDDVRTILAENFLTYQTPGSDSSPPFAEYVSGHSAFSSSAATVLERFTGDGAFGASVTFEPGESRFEPGQTPVESITLSWDTYREAADEAGISRIFGGIHFEDGDLNGRSLGDEVGEAVWEETLFFAGGGSSTVFGSLEQDEVDSEVSAELDGQQDLIFTGANDDLIDVSQSSFGNNRGYGGSGNDELFAGQDDRLFGSLGNDTIDASESRGGNRLYGGLGDDQFVLGGSNDRAIGGEGDDTFLATEGSGDNLITGGLGADVFSIANAGFPNAPNIITDFISGDDTLQMGGITDLNGFADLTIVDGDVGATISFNESAIATLRGVDAAQVSESDFTFL